MEWFWIQVIWNTGSFLESYSLNLDREELETLEDNDDVQDVPLEHLLLPPAECARRKRLVEANLKMQVQRCLRTNAALRLLKFFLSSRSALSNALRVGFEVDCSHVGGFNRMVSVVALVVGVGGLLQPMAPCFS